MNNLNILQIENIFKSFKVGIQDIAILNDINFLIQEEDFLIIFGPSGCGKSTLLHTILGLESPSSGQVILMNNNLYQNTTEDDRAVFRKQHLGMIYQQPYWIKSLNVSENVSFPLLLLGFEKEQALIKANQNLELVGMLKWASYVPTELSSGQQQKVALARALINNPSIIVADEPTGNLDFESGQEVMRLLVNLNSEQKKTIIMVTHDLEYIKYSKRVIRMLDGKIVGTYGQNSFDKLFEELKYKRGFLQNSGEEPLNKVMG